MNKKYRLCAIIAGIFLLAACQHKTPNYAAGDTIPEHQELTIESRQLGERRHINVYLPPEYLDKPDKTYPVLYMPDGGLREDFPHLANTIDALIAAEKMQPVILVGVENTQRRRDMTPPTTVESDKQIAAEVGGSANFRAFFRKELIPHIEQTYRGNGERGIIGESLAGLFVVENLLNEPGLYDKYIAFSPSLWWNRENLVKTAAAHLVQLPEKPLWLYLAAANEEDIAPQTERFHQELAAHAPNNLHWIYQPRPDLRHNTIYRQLKMPALQAMYPLQGSPLASTKPRP
jgi:predicted alpha/beta superfamily hydrolase